jgi:polyhydroxybutyrate depolymerase
MLSALRLFAPAAAILLGLACANYEDLPQLPIVDDPCATWVAPGLYRMDMGEQWSRQPMVYVPGSAGPRAGVIMLHGAGGTGRRMYEATRFAPLADLDGYVAVFPDGTGTVSGFTWNAGTCCGYAESIGIDDVAYLDAVADAVRERLCVDRVLAAGHSNGSMMAHRWTCEGAGPDAVVAAAGPLLLNTCEGDPTPVMTWHGDADPRVPYDGGATDEGETFPAAPDAFARIRARNQCTEDAPTVSVDGDTTCETWTCAAATTFCTIAGWEHAWPGLNQDRSGGPTIEDEALTWFDEVVPTIE